jgi:hypothetical protein
MLSDPHHRLMSQQLYWYDPVMLEAEVPRIEALLGLAASDISRVVGAPLQDLVEVLHVCTAILPTWAAWYFSMTETVESPGQLVEALRGAVAARGPTWIDAHQVPVLPFAQLLDESKVELRSGAAFLGVLGHTVDEWSSEQGFVQRLWEFRRRPVLVLPSGVAVPVAYNLGVAFRPTIERVLQEVDPPAFSRYDAAKGKWVERAALELLENRIRPDELWRSLRIPTETGELPERDGLAVVDTIALALEVKGGGMPPSARAGQTEPQKRVFQRLIRDAAEQVRTLAEALLNRQPVDGVDRDGRRLEVELNNPSRIIRVVVTLEDLAAVTSRAELVLEADAAESPWLLAMDELQWYSESLPLAAQLIHYAIVRSRLVHESVAVLDEGDWFRLYYMYGAAGCQAYVSNASELAETVFLYAGDVRRGRWPDLVTGWESPLGALLKQWDQDRPVGWLEASIAVLDLSDEQAVKFPSAVTETRSLSAPGDFPLLTMRPAADPTTALHVLVPAADADSVSMGSLVSWAEEHAPTAVRHVALVSIGEELGHLAVGPVFMKVPDDTEGLGSQAGA